MKLHVESGACHARASCADCQDPGATGVTYRLTRRSAGYLDLPANGAVLPCPHGQKPPPIVTADSGGPGTELRKLLKSFLGIEASPTCTCNRHAVQMNQWGPDECQARTPEIVDWLEAEYERRAEEARAAGTLFPFPFTRIGARILVGAAIRRARRAQIRHGGAGRG